MQLGDCCQLKSPEIALKPPRFRKTRAAVTSYPLSAIARQATGDRAAAAAGEALVKRSRACKLSRSPPPWSKVPHSPTQRDGPCGAACVFMPPAV